MKSKSTIVAVLLSLTQACWMLEAAHAQPGEHGKRDKSQQHNRHEQQHNQRPEHPSQRQNRMHSPQLEQRQSITGSSYGVSI